MLLRNVGNYLPVNTARYPRILESSWTQLSQPKISNRTCVPSSFYSSELLISTFKKMVLKIRHKLTMFVSAEISQSITTVSRDQSFNHYCQQRSVSHYCQQRSVSQSVTTGSVQSKGRTGSWDINMSSVLCAGKVRHRKCSEGLLVLQKKKMVHGESKHTMI
jgi:hypothetical protein